MSRFDFVIVLLISNSAPNDFNLKLEVYSCMLQDDLSMASTPRKLQKSLHTSITRTLGRKLAAALKDPSANNKSELYMLFLSHRQQNSITKFRYIILFVCRGPKFDLVATACLRLEDVHDSVKSHDLILENVGELQPQLQSFKFAM